MSARIILDTNVISEMVRPEPDSLVVAWYMRQESESLHTTVVTLAEALFGLEATPDGKRRDRLAQLSRTIFDEGLKGRILSFSETAAPFYARMRAAKRSKGLNMSPLDAQIAAIAAAAGAAVATRNVDDFKHCGVTVIDPWKG